MNDDADPQQSVARIQRPQINRTKTLLGIGLTAAYLLSLAAYMASDWPAFSVMKPGEWGNFLGGAFAPLAFLWLVLGFLQQGEELRHSADALWLQGEELQHSVEQQRQLVDVTREQLRFESTMLEQQREEIARNAQPILRLRQTGSMGGSEGTRVYDFSLLNHGKPCTEVKIDVEAKSKMETSALPSGSKFDFNLELSSKEVPPFRIRVDYLDERLLSGTKTFIVSGSSSMFEINESA